MKTTLSLLALLLSLSCAAQIGDKFPEMNAESLNNQTLSLPDDLGNKYALICLAYSKKAEDDLSQWFSPIYNNFIYKPETQQLFRINYDIHTYFVPMFTGAKRSAYKSAMKKAKEKVDPLLRSNILFYEGTIKHYKNALNLTSDKLPYFYILNPEGEIIHSTSGTYSDAKMQEIVNALAPSLE
ncbi:MAG: hypothetical protein OCD76_14855 [Reichenbachiella sp.]